MGVTLNEGSGSAGGKGWSGVGSGGGVLSTGGGVGSSSAAATRGATRRARTAAAETNAWCTRSDYAPLPCKLQRARVLSDALEEAVLPRRIVDHRGALHDA